MTEQQGDVLIYQTSNGGEINIADGLVEMAGGIETAAYLSMFGGNYDDDGLDNAVGWWGNVGESAPERQYHSETQFILNTALPIPSNLKRIEDAVKRDLQWFLDVGAASSIEVSATMPSVNKVNLVIELNADSRVRRIEFMENWRADSEADNTFDPGDFPAPPAPPSLLLYDGSFTYDGTYTYSGVKIPA